jgi:DNA-binding IclR family transcriptional regulator
MRALADETGETVYLSTWIHDDAVVTSLIDGKHELRVAGIRVGMRGSVHARASGKLLLAMGPEGRVESFLSRMPHLEDYTGRTITDPADLKKELAQIRRQGYALDLEERFPEVCCLAVPLGWSEPGKAAVTVMSPKTRFAPMRKSLLPRLLQMVA